MTPNDTHAFQGTTEHFQFLKSLRHDPILFGQLFLKSWFKLPSPQFHREIVREYTDPDIKLLNVIAPRGHAKCSRKNTKINMLDGSVRFIQDIKPGDKVVSVSLATGKTQGNTVLAVEDSGVKPLITFTTRSHRKITVTAEHRLLTFNGYKQAGEITKDDYLIAAGKITTQSDSPNTGGYELPTIIGYMLADGSLSSGNCSFTKQHPGIVENFHRCITALGGEITHSGKLNYKITGLRPLFRQLEMYGSKSTNKRVPKICFQFREKDKWTLLSALMDTDGFIAEEAGRFAITLANLDLLEDIQTLFTHVGVKTSILERTQNDYQAWQLTIDPNSYALCLKNMLLIRNHEKFQQLCKKHRYSQTDAFPNAIKKSLVNAERILRSKGIRVDNQYEITRAKLQRMYDAVPVPQWSYWLNADIYPDAITSITHEAPDQTYDIQVERDENFIANGLVSHNSTIVAGLLPLHHLLLKDKPTDKRFVVLISKTQAQAERLLNSIKEELDSNARLQSTFGDYGHSTARKWTDKFVVLKDGSAILALGAGMQARGLKHESQRPTLIIGDDLEDEENTKTSEAMEATLGWFLKAILPARDMQSGRVFLIGTPLNYRCLVLTVKEMPGWKSLHYSAEANPTTKTSLWPDHLSWDQLMVMKAGLDAIGRTSFYYQEYCCAVISDETRLFKPEYINYCSASYDPSTKTLTYTPCDSNGTPAGDTTTLPADAYTGIDPASSTSERADYTVILNIAVTHDGRIFVLDYIRGRFSPHETIEHIISNYQGVRSLRTSLETTGAQEIFRDFLLKSNVHIPGISIKHQPRDRKERRHIELLEPYFRSKKIYMHPHSHRHLLDELKLWPKAKNDDLLDGLYYAVLHIVFRNTSTTAKAISKTRPSLDKSYLVS